MKKYIPIAIAVAILITCVVVLALLLMDITGKQYIIKFDKNTDMSGWIIRFLIGLIGTSAGIYFSYRFLRPAAQYTASQYMTQQMGVPQQMMYTQPPQYIQPAYTQPEHPVYAQQEPPVYGPPIQPPQYLRQDPPVYGPPIQPPQYLRQEPPMYGPPTQPIYTRRRWSAQGPPRQLQDEY